MKHDFKKLDVDRARMNLSVQAARDIVDSWIASGGGDNDSDTDSDEPLVAQSASIGLGYEAPIAVSKPSFALERLRKTTTGKKNTNSGSTSRNNTSSVTSVTDSESEEESRTTFMAKKRPENPVPHSKKEHKKRKLV